MRHRPKNNDGFVTLIPHTSIGTPNISQAKYPTNSDHIFHRFIAFYQDIGGLDYPYCKLEFLSILKEKCCDDAWITRHSRQLIEIYFSIIYDRGLLFAQTREHTALKNAFSYRNYMTNIYGIERPERKEIFERSIEKVVEIFEEQGDDLLSRDNFYAMLEIVKKDLFSSARGKPHQLVVSIHREGHERYDTTKVFGKSASQYYLDHIARLGIEESLWKEMVETWLDLLGLNIKAYTEQYGKYKPYFSQKQYEDFKHFQDQVREKSKFLNEILKHTHAENFKDAIPLSNKLSVNEKLNTFEQCFKRTFPGCHTSPDAIGILFILRTHLHPILGRNQNIKYPTVPYQKQNFISIGDGLNFFDTIQKNMDGCLLYTVHDLLAFDRVHIKSDDFEKELPILDPHMREILLKTPVITSDIIQSYAKLFYDPVYQGSAVRTLLQPLVDMLDWSGIPLEESIKKYRNSRYVGSMIDRIPFWKNCLIEYYVMQELIAQGHQNLQEITRILFRTLGDS